MDRGVTLPELLICLLLLGIGGSVFMDQVRSQADHLAVRAVREEVVALFHRARMEARLRGESRVLIREGEGVLLLSPHGEVVDEVASERRGVEIHISGDRSEVEIRFGPRGLAGFASTTLELERRGKRAQLVVSSYGRIRR
jgi:prepilin-type N-terminal cleavage/methylation domain-containing protein